MFELGSFLRGIRLNGSHNGDENMTLAGIDRKLAASRGKSGAGNAPSGSSTAASNNNTILTGEQKQEIKEAFELFDTTNSGSIDSKELKLALRALGIDINKDELKQIMTDVNR